MGNQKTFHEQMSTVEIGFSKLSNLVTGLHEAVSSLCSPSINETSQNSIMKRTRNGNKSVSFGDLEIRSYPVILGDNPFCHSGCPLQLDWEYIDASKEAIDRFESNRAPRRSPAEFRTTWIQRQEILSSELILSTLTQDERDDVLGVTRQLTRCKSMEQNLASLTAL